MSASRYRRSAMAGPGVERDDPWGGAFGAALAVRAGDFVFTSTISGVLTLELNDGVPQFAQTFDEQLRLAGQHIRDRLERLGCTTADIVDASVTLHPSVDIDAGVFLDRLQDQVFAGTAPAVSVVRAASAFPESLVSVKVIAYKPR
jgi:enamine deaminase RidA (YjgF/YER057c/UK114 family)